MHIGLQRFFLVLYLEANEFLKKAEIKGDKNTKFFYNVAYLNIKHNTVESLVVNGFVSQDTSEIREHILQFYSSLYSEQFS